MPATEHTRGREVHAAPEPHHREPRQVELPSDSVGVPPPTYDGKPRAPPEAYFLEATPAETRQSTFTPRVPKRDDQSGRRWLMNCCIILLCISSFSLINSYMRGYGRVVCIYPNKNHLIIVNERRQSQGVFRTCDSYLYGRNSGQSIVTIQRENGGELKGFFSLFETNENDNVFVTTQKSFSQRPLSGFERLVAGTAGVQLNRSKFSGSYTSRSTSAPRVPNSPSLRPIAFSGHKIEITSNICTSRTDRGIPCNWEFRWTVLE